MASPPVSPRVEFVQNSQGSEGVHLSDLIDEIGFGTFQYKLLLVCGLGWAADAAELVALAFLILELRDDPTWLASGTELALLTSMVFLGMGVGAYVFGVCADKFGRKSSFLITVLVTSVFGCLSAFSPNMTALIILRFFTGFGIGGNLPVDFSMFTEFVSMQHRGFATTILNSFWCIGELFACFLAMFLIPTYGWREFLFASSLLGFVILFFRRDIPESPRYLMVHGRSQEAWDILKYVAKVNGKALRRVETIIVEVEAEPVGVTDLISTSYRTTTLLLWFSWFAEAVVHLGLYLFLPTYLARAQIGREDLYRDVLLATSAGLPGFLLAAYVVDVFGRKPMLYVGFTCLSSLVVVFGMLAALKVDQWTLMSVIFPMKFIGTATSSVLYLYTSEVFPTILRATGIGSCSVAKRCAGAVVPLLGEAMMSHGLGNQTIFVWAAFGYLTALASFALPIETSNRSLQDAVDPCSERTPLCKADEED